LKTTVHISRCGDFDATFGDLGAKVGPRTGAKKRTKDEMEWYVARRFLKEAIAKKIFRVPLTIEKAQAPEPDFILQHERRSLV
jgi:hypothetical protein